MKKRTMTKTLTSLIMITLLLLAGLPVMAAAKAPKVESCKYKKKKVEVEFKGKVQYKDPAVKVADSKGNQYTATIIDLDDEEIEFKVKGLKAGKKYTYTITGICKKGSKSYTKVSGSFRISGKKKVVVEKVDYDASDREVTFEFQGSVKWKKAKVTIKDYAGKNYVKKIKEKDRDEIEVSVKKLTPGKKYTYKISGVAKKGSGSYKTVKGTFIP